MLAQNEFWKFQTITINVAPLKPFSLTHLRVEPTILEIYMTSLPSVGQNQ
jgi:hypothetical protein